MQKFILKIYSFICAFALGLCICIANLDIAQADDGSVGTVSTGVGDDGSIGSVDTGAGGDGSIGTVNTGAGDDGSIGSVDTGAADDGSVGSVDTGAADDGSVGSVDTDPEEEGTGGSVQITPIDDTQLEVAVCQLLALITGSFGALLTVVAGIGAVCWAAVGDYSKAYSFISVSVGCFIIPAIISFWFKTYDCNFIMFGEEQTFTIGSYTLSPDGSVSTNSQGGLGTGLTSENASAVMLSNMTTSCRIQVSTGSSFGGANDEENIDLCVECKLGGTCGGLGNTFGFSFGN